MPLYRFRINERVNGVNCNSYAAEAFLNYNVLEWMKEIERIRPQENDRASSFMKLAEALKLNLGNMSIVRSISRNIYSILESNNSKK